jgi:hypothetical protein
LKTANLRNIEKSDDNGLCDYKDLDVTDTVHTDAFAVENLGDMENDGSSV